ncbi:DUF7261 family protein [Halostagnicola bangensis]
MTRSRDRGQLLLVGSVAIAFVLLGLVLTFNGMVYTETASSSAESRDRGAMQATEHGIVDGVQHIVEAAWNEDEFEFEADIERAVAEYVEQYRRMNAAGGTAVVSAELAIVEDEGEIRRFSGERIGADGELLFEGEFSKFDIETATDTVTQEIAITAVPLEGDPVELSLAPTGDGAISVGTADGNACTVETSNAELDLVTGDDGVDEENSGDCEYDVLESERAYESVTVDPTNDAVLESYDVVTSGSDTRVQNAESTGVEFAELTLQYDSSDVTTERTHAIYGFGEGP